MPYHSPYTQHHIYINNIGTMTTAEKIVEYRYNENIKWK